jgi:hypothetical protein
VIDPNHGSPLFRKSFDQPFGDASPGPVSARAERRMHFGSKFIAAAM